MIEKELRTYALETYAKRSINYLNRMTDKNGLPYFNIFRSEPAEAAHDWPDFNDVSSRQLQASIMLRHMTGKTVCWESKWYTDILSRIDPETGFINRPETNFSKNEFNIVDHALILYALVTTYIDRKDDVLGNKILRMVSNLLSSFKNREWGTDSATCPGYIIKGLMVCARHLASCEASELAGLLSEKVFSEYKNFTPDNTFSHGGHMHGNLGILAGIADYALFTRQPILYSRVDAVYNYIKSTGTRFGFIPEVVGRKGDIIACETCALMDFISLATTLANHGHPEYWGDIERMARNHLLESQVRDGSWLVSDTQKEDTSQFTWRAVGDRMVGGYAGWSSPNHILACEEELHWGGDELRGRIRAFQNCCGGSGTHAMYIVWKNASRFENECLSVNLHMDKLLSQAEIRCFQPYEGLLRIDLKQACNVKIRIPEFIKPEEMKAESNGNKITGLVWGNYLELGKRAENERLEIRYPLPVYNEQICIGNSGFRQYNYTVTWKGDTVVSIQPEGNDCRTGYSELEKRNVPVFYGNEGPEPLYERAYMLQEKIPEMSDIYMDTSSIDFWLVK